MICTGPEYVLKDRRGMLYPGDRVIFRGQRLAVAGEESRLEGGKVKTTYLLRGEDGYSGRPENGDTLYLYFPTEHENDRSVIGGGAGYETIWAVT